MSRGAGALVIAVVTTACSGEAPPPAEERALSGLVARVGNEGIAKETIARIAAAQGVSIEEARERAVADALLAAAARDDLDARTVRSAENRALAWALLGELWQEAQKQPIRDEELAEATAAHWVSYDRPRSHRILHAIVHAKEGDAPAESHTRARAAAERIREALVDVARQAREEGAPTLIEADVFAGASSAQSDPIRPRFEEVAEQAGRGDQRVSVHLEPPVAADGTVVASGMQPDNRAYDQAFASAAAALVERGDLSEVVQTSHGYHVIMLLGVVPEKRVPAEVRRRELSREILRVRGLRAQRALLERLAAERGVEIADNHAAILEQALRPSETMPGAPR